MDIRENAAITCITMKGFVLISILAALTASEGLSRERRQHEFSGFSFPHSSSSSSSFSSSFEGTGEMCLNGGSSVPSLTSGEHMFCLCNDGFEGIRCEKVKGADCFEGMGLYYRGTQSKSESGRICVEWDSDTRWRFMSSDVHSGRHNYCRNLLYKRRPWCLVWENQQLVWEYCRIPRCVIESCKYTLSLKSSNKIRAKLHVSSPAAELTCGQRSRRKQTKIVGGTVATVESHPWVAAIFRRSKSQKKVFLCGGSLISACWVLTAAHCFPGGSHAKHRRFSVILGKDVMNETDPTVEQTFRVEEIILHDGFDNSEGNYNNDIALLKLKAKYGKCSEESDSVRTVCLPPPQQKLQPGVTCEIAGYGKENQSLWYKSQFLREAQVNLLADDVCRHQDYYANMISDNMFCASVPDWSQDACEGDSGGPLVCEVGDRLFLFGVVSWGEGCAKKNRPGVYTTVTNYNGWIEEKTGLSSITKGSMFPQK
ncbi:plasminogen activator, urokinase b [Anoplopoma fimbria]|uniref:plasminogen activator, urokinase b n=1 Tax=Anoplopoma fimbria TaxID=229290 RepID=UPI0023EA8562|nr:plasminogen activator, urokinase b [Anoplopoma fimbria]